MNKIDCNKYYIVPMIENECINMWEEKLSFCKIKELSYGLIEVESVSKKYIKKHFIKEYFEWLLYTSYIKEAIGGNFYVNV